MSGPGDPTLLERLERYCDSVPRGGARAEAVGPFTLFVATDGSPFYARPRLGLSSPISPGDVTGVLARQRELGVPEAIEWVVETTPSLSGAARPAGMHVEEVPLLVLARPLAIPVPDGVELRRVAADEPDLARVMAVAAVAFAHPGTMRGPAGLRERDILAASDTADRSGLRRRLATGATVMMVAEDRDGPIASGAHQPIDGVTEIVGVATLPSARRRGVGTALTGALVAHASSSGPDLVFLSAADDDGARIYERSGFRRVAHAGLAAAPDA